jgi:hypothetical protein
LIVIKIQLISPISVGRFRREERGERGGGGERWREVERGERRGKTYLLFTVELKNYKKKYQDVAHTHIHTPIESFENKCTMKDKKRIIKFPYNFFFFKVACGANFTNKFNKARSAHSHNN